LYRANVVKPLDYYTYPDNSDIFHREPFIAKFKTKTGNYEFVLITIHTDPDDATNEINSLDKVINDAKAHFPDEDDFIVLGDLNADCDYYNENDNSSAIRSDKYKWLIPNSADTNLSTSKDCTYDRIIVTANTEKEDFAGEEGIFRFDDYYGLNETMAKKISDHYPVYCKFYTNKDTGIKSAQSANLIPSTTKSTSEGITVYKTPKGKKYHRKECPYIKGNSFALTLEEAKKMGLSPCSYCKPEN
jgi:hypothetical protein